MKDALDWVLPIPIRRDTITIIMTQTPGLPGSQAICQNLHTHTHKRTMCSVDNAEALLSDRCLCTDGCLVDTSSSNVPHQSLYTFHRRKPYCGDIFGVFFFFNFQLSVFGGWIGISGIITITLQTTSPVTWSHRDNWSGIENSAQRGSNHPNLDHHQMAQLVSMRHSFR